MAVAVIRGHQAPLELPTEERYKSVLSKLQAAFDELEVVAQDLRRASDAFEREEAERVARIRLADVGQLYSFSSSVDAQLDQLRREADEIERQVYFVDLIRLDQGGDEKEA